jgi:hypothetical protein
VTVPLMLILHADRRRPIRVSECAVGRLGVSVSPLVRPALGVSPVPRFKCRAM